MNPITDEASVEQYRSMVREMTLAKANREYDIDPEWASARGWKVAPVEDSAHFSPEQISVIVPALKRAGMAECVAVAAEPVDPAPSCYQMVISEDEFTNFNRECGFLRYVLTDGERSWAISCNEWYNLFAGPEKLVEAMIGAPVARGREEFLRFAAGLAKGDPEYPLLKVAQRYAS
ncbi:MAG: hypothetical protein ACRD2P_09215 [Terriglobia bacterium]